MPIRPCPNCEAQTPRVLDASSEGAVVWYYRCPSCGHIWTRPKDGTDVIRDVTPRKAPQKGTA
jgi:ssDNA-binding Zn-finger/Zn-ribbon topoisomerase 1